MDVRYPETVNDVIDAGLCIGCGLCEALAPKQWKMRYTAEGKLRPDRIGPGSDKAILEACPGAIARSNAEDTPRTDLIWGGHHRMQEAWAADPDIRHRASTGGVLTALGAALLESGKADFILHCEADPDVPMRTRWCLSEDVDALMMRAGSRYGPSDTLAGLSAAVSRDQPFAIIAKPCDAGAVRERAKSDPHLERNLVALLVMVCGGASDLQKSLNVLSEFNITEDDLTLFRYRGYGNPGATQIETSSSVHTKSYTDMWADESGWRIQSRCKVCPDALGEAADIAAADIWVDGMPTDEEEATNGIITRTARGELLLQEAIAGGQVCVGSNITAREFDRFQPHQVRKKHALASRLRGMISAGSPIYRHEGLRVAELDKPDVDQEEGTKKRVLEGRFNKG